jgi:putative tryptophan/tyrosine transport system substrate-binding protein
MQRRKFIALIGCAALAWPRGKAGAQQFSKPVIGFIHGGSPSAYAPFVDAFKQGLRQAGFVEGQDVVIHYRWGEGKPERSSASIAELVRLPVDVMVVGGGDAAAAEAKALTTTIPIIATFGSDPVEGGIVPNLNRPGANVTGISVFAVQLVEKRLELARQLVPQSTIAYLANPTNPQSKIDLAEMKATAAKVGQVFVVFGASTEAECDKAFMQLSGQAKAVIVESDPFFNGMAERLATLARKYAIPAVFPRREFAMAGGLVSYGSNLSEAYRELGIYAARVLKGDKPGDLPIVLPTRFELVINLKTAKVLGLAMPTDILLRADEVIE